MGVDVASFGDFFADKRMSIKSHGATAAFDNASAGKSLDPAQPLVEISVGSNAVSAPALLWTFRNEEGEAQMSRLDTWCTTTRSAQHTKSIYSRRMGSTSLEG